MSTQNTPFSNCEVENLDISLLLESELIDRLGIDVNSITFIQRINNVTEIDWEEGEDSFYLNFSYTESGDINRIENISSEEVADISKETFIC